VRKWIPLWVFPVVLVFATGTIWLRLSIVRTAYAINQTNRKIHAARQDKESLQLKVAGLRSPRRLESLARTKFGLSQPSVRQVVRLKKLETTKEL
jgi:cell division protein FtsL